MRYKRPEFKFDERDAAIVDAHHWHLNKVGNTTYVRSTQTREYLHRIIMGAEPGFDVDHIDGDGTNCTRANMRLATRSQNNMNRRPQRAGRKGIHFDAATGMWRAEIWLDGKRHRSPRLLSEELAIEAREQFEREYHADFSGFGTAS